jgi:serine O-acetyltransferase
MFKEIEQDYRRYSKKSGTIAKYFYAMLLNHGFRAIALYRLCRWFLKRKRYHLAGLMEQLIFHTCHCEISRYAEIAPGCRIAHTVGLVVGDGTHIGPNCDLRQNVTFGGNFNRRDDEGRSQPWLKDNISVGAGAVIIGPVMIGSNSIIGANSVVTRNVPDNVIVSGIPAKVIKKRWPNSEKR